MTLDRYSHYLTAFRLACGEDGFGRRFAVRGADKEVRDAGGEIHSALQELPVAELRPADFVFLFDTLQKLDESGLKALLERLSATGCKLFVVVPLRYSERLLEDGVNEQAGGAWRLVG
jgi:hypothetical protein